MNEEVKIGITKGGQVGIGDRVRMLRNTWNYDKGEVGKVVRVWTDIGRLGVHFPDNRGTSYDGIENMIRVSPRMVEESK